MICSQTKNTFFDHILLYIVRFPRIFGHFYSFFGRVTRHIFWNISITTQNKRNRRGRFFYMVLMCRFLIFLTFYHDPGRSPPTAQTGGTLFFAVFSNSVADLATSVAFQQQVLRFVKVHYLYPQNMSCTLSGR